MEHKVIWHRQPKVVTELIDHAVALRERYPNADFLGVGQSPAWLLRTMCLVGKRCGQRTRVNIMPFSKHFIKLDAQAPKGFSEKTETIDGRFVKTFNVERPKNHYLYHKRLRERAQSPQCIIDNYRRNGRPTVIIDYTHNARGLASYMYLMCAWAKECGDDVLNDFLEATKVQALVEFGGINAMRFPDIGVELPVENYKVSELFTHYFADADNAAPDRLVRYYPNDKWGEDPGRIVSHSITCEIAGMLGMAVDKRFEKAVAPKRPATSSSASALPNDCNGWSIPHPAG